MGTASCTTGAWRRGRNRTDDGLFLQTAAFPLGYRALLELWQEQEESNPPLALLETAALPLHHTPVLLCLSVVKEQKKKPAF